MLLKKQIFILILSAFVLTVPFAVSARGLVPCGGYSDSSGTREAPCTILDTFVLIARLTNWLIGVAGVYGVYVIINSSFGVITSMGNEENITKYKSTLANAVVGLVLVLMAFMLINTVVNGLLTRNFVTDKYPQCKLDLTNPITYLSIDPKQCTSIYDANLHNGTN